METNIVDLIRLCSVELDSREYGSDYKMRISRAWNLLQEWMEQREITDFSESVGNAFCDEMIGTHLSQKVFKKSQRVYLRATRMLISYQRADCFEERSPRIEHVYTGTLGEWILQYLDFLRDQKRLRPTTILGTEKSLRLFYEFMRGNCYRIDDLSLDMIAQFQKTRSHSASSLHHSSSAVRQYLRYLHEQSLVHKDCSIYVVSGKHRRNSNIPTTYTEEEISKTIAAVDRASAIGKRNYLILLLAAEYGWRSSDIRKFSLDQIDWEKNVVYLTQSKTGTPVEFPLLASVGNAIIDYLTNGRPDTTAKEIILSVRTSRKAKPLSAPAVSYIVAQYLEKAEIDNWRTKKHGAHAFRHSLASNMLRNQVTLPIIGAVLGHGSTESTKVYLKIDTDGLKACALPMPPMNSPYFRKGV